MLCQPFANRFRCYSEIFRQLIHCYPSIHIAGIESSFYAACSILFSLGWGLFAAEVSPERRVFRIKIAIRLYVLQHSGIIYPMHGVIEPKIDRSELRELTCNWISVTKKSHRGWGCFAFWKVRFGGRGGMCKKPLCYIRAFTTPLLRPSLFARVCVGSGGLKWVFKTRPPHPQKEKAPGFGASRIVGGLLPGAVRKEATETVRGKVYKNPWIAHCLLIIYDLSAEVNRAYFVLPARHSERVLFLVFIWSLFLCLVFTFR